MNRISIIPLFLIALLSAPALGQDIILLNQDGEKVGVAKDVDSTASNKDVDEKKVPVADDSKPKPQADKGGAKLENGVITVTNADGTTQQFSMSDARSITITRSSKSVVGEDGQQKTVKTGKAILIGPDGVRREIDLGSGGISGGSATKTTAPKTFMIGVSCTPASPVLRSQLQLEDGFGLVITRVLRGGAAEIGGFQNNDIVMFADQKPVGDRKTLSKIVNEAGTDGNKITFTLLRGGEEISATVTPTEREGVNQMMGELGSGLDGFEMDFPGFGPGMDFEFRQLGPGIIIGRGGKGEAEAFAGDFQDQIQRIQDEMEEMRQRMRDRE
jgi:hypothetical protein